MPITQVCANINTPIAVIILAIAVASRFYGLFLRQGIAQRSLIAFLYENPGLPTRLLNEIRFYQDNEPIVLSGGTELSQQIVGFEDDLVLTWFRPSLAALRALERVASSLEANLARQPAYRSVITTAFETLPEELTSHPVVVISLQDGSFLPAVSTLIQHMEDSVQFNEARFLSAIEGFDDNRNRCHDTAWLFASLHIAASFAEDPDVCETRWLGLLKMALDESEDLLETKGLSALFIDALYNFCDCNRGCVLPLSSQLNEIGEAKKSIFYASGYYLIPDEIFSAICSRVPEVMPSQINRALANDAIQVTETCNGKLKYTQGHHISIAGKLHKVRFHKLKQDAVDCKAYGTLRWVASGRTEDE